MALERQIHWLQNASNQGWLSLLDEKLCPIETFPCVFEEIGQVEHTGQSKGNVNKWGGYKTSCAILFGIG